MATLPDLPPPVKRAVFDAAARITTALESCGLSPAKAEDIPSDYLYSVLHLLKHHCLSDDRRPFNPDAESFSLTEIVTVLTALGQIMNRNRPNAPRRITRDFLKNRCLRATDEG